MGFLDRLRQRLAGGADRRAPAGRVLDVPSGYNVRELGGYATAGGPTLMHRYLRSGGTEYLVACDVDYLLAYGVTHVLDLRGEFESPQRTCRFARRKDVTWLNVPLFDYDISDPRLLEGVGAGQRGNYLVDSYLTMLANRPAIRRILTFFDEVPQGECTLFHCAAGMDRTGVTALLLLGLAGVSRRDVIADYAYSFAGLDEVDAAVDGFVSGRGLEGVRPELAGRITAVAAVCDAIAAGYGSVHDYLLECDLDAALLARLAARMVGDVGESQDAPRCP